MRTCTVFAAAAALLLSASIASAQDIDRRVLPMPDPPFKGTIGLTPADSVKDFPKPVEAPEGAPNILIILTDDVGFGASSTFGGPIPTPTMDRIANQVERDPNYVNIMRAQRTEPEATGSDAISAAARQIAETLNLAAICCYTSSGTTAMRAARERPNTPIIALSPVVNTARRLAIVWGLHCLFGDEPNNLDDMVNHACFIAHQEGAARPGDRIIITAGVPLGTPGATNMLRIAYVAEGGFGSA